MILAAVCLLGPLIAIHEFGHYWVARAVGVKVLTYSIGFGPRILSWTSRKTGIEYRLALLPLGGYVKMLDEREGTVKQEDLQFAFNRQSVWKRFAIVAAGPLINLLFAVVLFWVLFLPQQEQLNTTIGKVLVNSPAMQAGLQAQDKITQIDGKSVSTWDALSFALVDRAGETGQIQVQAEHDGKLKLYTLPIQNFLKNQNQSALEQVGFLPYRPKIEPIVSKLTDDGAAIRQGMQVGDKILKINNTQTPDWFDVVDIVQKSPEKLLDFQVLRNSQIVNLQIMPQAKPDGTGALGVQSNQKNYIVPDQYKQTIQYTPIEALEKSFTKTTEVSSMILGSMVKMVRGLIGLENLSGPITIAKVAGQSAEMGWQTFLAFMAMMSISLGILNLLPIPMLDGGHLVYYFIEAIRGKPVSERIQMIGFKIGVVLLGSMMFLALFNDFMRL